MEESLASLALIVGVGVAYWLALSPAPRSARLFALCPAALYLAGFAYALALMPVTANLEIAQRPPFFWPHRLFYGAGLVAAIWVLLRLRTKIWPHVAQVLFLVPAAMLWLVGAMALAHDWL